MSADRWQVDVRCARCAAPCCPLTLGTDNPTPLTPRLQTQRVVACTECATEFLLTVELAPIRQTKTNDGLTATKPRKAPAGRSIYEDARRSA